MLTRGGIYIRNPRLMFTEPEVEAGTTPVVTEPTFPANTPVKDMTPEQQAAYNLHQARKHEDRVKAFGEWTPEKIAELAKEAEELRKKNLTDAEKAIDEAKEQGRAEVRSILAAERVKNALDRALEGRLPNTSALLDLDRAQFIDGDKANVDAIAKWVEENSTASGEQQKPFPNLYQGTREQIATSDRATGTAEAEKRFGKKS